MSEIMVVPALKEKGGVLDSKTTKKIYLFIQKYSLKLLHARLKIKGTRKRQCLTV